MSFKTGKKTLSLRNMEVKILKNILANQIKCHIKIITHHDQVGFIPGSQEWFNICKSTKGKSHIDAEKAFDKIQ